MSTQQLPAVLWGEGGIEKSQGMSFQLGGENSYVVYKVLDVL
jgi:hypothetical protein